MRLSARTSSSGMGNTEKSPALRDSDFDWGGHLKRVVCSFTTVHPLRDLNQTSRDFDCPGGELVRYRDWANHQGADSVEAQRRSGCSK